ncbi:MAG: hypothetical protein K1Y36_10085 [Blastocatellia bacterium]|nr:hypothetical protein [Blastocatellia bacterium]
MNEKERQHCNQLVLREVETLLQPQGFTWARDGLFFREQPLVLEAMYFNLQGYSPHYLVSLGIRVLNDPLIAFGLNGPSTYTFTPAAKPNGKPVKFGFTTTPVSHQKCAKLVEQYFLEVAQPWFECWRDPAKLLSDPDTPLMDEVQECLRELIAGKADPERIRYSRSLVGLT